MISQADLEARGWVFDATAGEASVGVELRVRVSSDFPLFALIRAANHLEGDDELMDEQITPTLVQEVSGETWDDSADVAAAQQAQQAAAAAALVEFRMIRDRILAQTDYIEVFLANPAGFAPLPQPIQDAINTNKDAWIAWRQALRDMPTKAGLDPAAAAAHQPHVSTQMPWPAEWPQPPAAPVIHFT